MKPASVYSATLVYSVIGACAAYPGVLTGITIGAVDAVYPPTSADASIEQVKVPSPLAVACMYAPGTMIASCS